MWWRLRDRGKKTCTITEKNLVVLFQPLRSCWFRACESNSRNCAGQHGIRVVGLVIKPSYMSQLVFWMDLSLYKPGEEGDNAQSTRALRAVDLVVNSCSPCDIVSVNPNTGCVILSLEGSFSIKSCAAPHLEAPSPHLLAEQTVGFDSQKL